MKKMLSMLAGAVLLLAACNKEKQKDVTVTKETLAGSYRLIASESQTGNGPVENDYQNMEACEKDDLLKLNTDMTWNAVDAGTRCNPPGDDNGTWSLPSSSQLVVDGETFNIKSFDGHTLVLEYTYGSGNSAYRSKVTMTK